MACTGHATPLRHPTAPHRSLHSYRPPGRPFPWFPSFFHLELFPHRILLLPASITFPEALWPFCSSCKPRRPRNPICSCLRPPTRSLILLMHSDMTLRPIEATQTVGPSSHASCVTAGGFCAYFAHVAAARPIAAPVPSFSIPTAPRHPNRRLTCVSAPCLLPYAPCTPCSHRRRTNIQCLPSALCPCPCPLRTRLHRALSTPPLFLFPNFFR
ncbi:hypothetical protein JB92DRAFT_1329166 [Gautieria morchelliformis]|nr:hypothetical protein JB92DRAFT_1329166 [Gautieria morchelliformis]